MFQIPKNFHDTNQLVSIIKLLFLGFQMTMYVSIGSEVKLACSNDNVQIWQYCNSKDVIAQCNNGQNRINPNLDVSGRIHITQDCQLIIQNISLEDLTTYLCTSDDGNSEEIHVKRRSK